MVKKYSLEDLQKADAPLYVDARSIAHLIGCSPQALYVAFQNGTMPYACVVTGKHVYISVASFLAVTLGRQNTGRM